MASNQSSPREANLSLPSHVVDQQTSLDIVPHGPPKKTSNFRPQLLRLIALGTESGLVSIASLLIGVGTVKHDTKTMMLTGLVGLVAGAWSIAIGEYVSAHSQLDMEVAQMKREMERLGEERVIGEGKEANMLISPVQAAALSTISFSLGGVVPLLAASFIREYSVRVGVVVVVVSVAAVGFGWLAAVFGRAPKVWISIIRFLAGVWLAMAISYGLAKLIE